MQKVLPEMHAHHVHTSIALGVYKDELYDTGVHARIAEF